MSYQEIILHELSHLPNYQQRELLNFLLLLKQKNSKPATAAKEDKPAAIPEFGGGAIEVKMSFDFDAPLEDFKAYMA